MYVSLSDAVAAIHKHMRIKRNQSQYLDF